VDLERKSLLEDNGFRVGQVGGITPEGLQSLLTSDRSCANPRRIQLHAGKPARLVLGPTAAQCSFQMVRDGAPVNITLEQAQATVEVVPSLAKDGRVKLTFVPQVQHGEAAQLIRPAEDHSGFMLQMERPTERYPSLAWEVTLAPNEYVVVGARFDQAQTLGHSCFVRIDEPRPVQRVLVIRTSRAEPEATSPVVGGEGFAPQALPLATQASWSVVRGTAP
jgi:hypothetical protein